MRSFLRSVSVALALASPSCALKVVGGNDVTQDVNACQTICQRFGMKSLAKEFTAKGQKEVGDAFAAMSSPVECSEKCAQALTQKNDPVAAVPVLAEAHSEKQKACAGAE